VINDYLKLVTKSGNAPQRVTCFTTYMITQITKGSNYLNHFCNNKVCFQGSIQLFLAYPYIWQRVKESEVYGSKKDIYFVPINKDGNHWVLVVFYANKKGKVFGQFCCWELIFFIPLNLSPESPVLWQHAFIEFKGISHSHSHVWRHCQVNLLI